MRERSSEEVADDRAVMGPPRRGAYADLSRRDASRMGDRLVSAAHRTGAWVHLPEHLTILRAIAMQQGRRAA